MTEHDDEIRRLRIEEGLGRPAIAARLGLKEHVVRAREVALDLPPARPGPRPRRQPDVSVPVTLREHAGRWTAVADAYGIEGRGEAADAREAIGHALADLGQGLVEAVAEERHDAARAAREG